MVSCEQRPKSVPTEKKNAIFNDPAFIPNMKVYSPVPIHYSNVSLVLQRSPEQEARDEFARQQGEGSSGPLPEAVATRLRATNVRYDWKQRRWQWKRLAENVAEIDPVTGHKLSAEWPKQDRFTKFTIPKPYIRESEGVLTGRLGSRYLRRRCIQHTTLTTFFSMTQLPTLHLLTHLTRKPHVLHSYRLKIQCKHPLLNSRFAMSNS
jgi:hypothetical protein